MASRSTRIAVGATAAASATLALFTASSPAQAFGPTPAGLGFTPITTNALPCSASGYVAFANDSFGAAVTPTVLMKAGDPATPVNAPATSNKVGRENDMIALGAGGKYLYTVSENESSDGVTRLTLKGRDAGKKEILADNVDATGKNLWSRVDGIKSYPFGGSDGEGVLLASEEFSTGGVWQVDPRTGAFTRLDWIGNYSHEGIGLDDSGNLYLGDENRTGAIYKAVPNDVTDLTKGGTLYYLVDPSVDASGWKVVTNPVNAIAEASAGGATLFDRPEDFDERNGRVYFTVTEPNADAATRHGAAGQSVNGGGVYTLDTVGVPQVKQIIAVNDPKYTSASEAKAQQGLQFPDNLAFDGEGHLWVHEDIPDGSSFPASGIDVSKQVRDQQDELYVYVLNEAGDAIIANPDTSGPGVSGGYKAADMRTSPAATPCQNEFTGGIFGADGKTLFLNQQHAENATLTIRLH
jgi:secreted PhoX family phosphatase